MDGEHGWWDVDLIFVLLLLFVHTTISLPVLITIFDSSLLVLLYLTMMPKMAVDGTNERDSDAKLPWMCRRRKTGNPRDGESSLTSDWIYCYPETVKR